MAIMFRVATMFWVVTMFWVASMFWVATMPPAATTHPTGQRKYWKWSIYKFYIINDNLIESYVIYALSWNLRRLQTNDLDLVASIPISLSAFSDQYTEVLTAFLILEAEADAEPNCSVPPSR